MADYQALTCKVREKVQKIKYCPITGGLPTRMSLDSFRRQCGVHQERARLDKPGRPGSGVKVLWCRQCKGTVPPRDLEFVDFETDGLEVGRVIAKKEIVTKQVVRKKEKREKTVVAEVKKTKGETDMTKGTASGMEKCALCGENGKRSKRLYAEPDGMMVCSSCKPILLAARNRPHALVAAVDKYKLIPMAELCEMEPVLSNEDLQAKVDNLGFLEERVERLESLAHRVGDLWSAYTELETMRIGMRQGS